MEQRRTKRFRLSLPLAITRTGTDRVTLTGTTRNISSTGVLFTAPERPDPGNPIEYIITLHTGSGQPVHLRCVGKVVRSELLPDQEPASYATAATLERYEFVRDRAGAVSSPA